MAIRLATATQNAACNAQVDLCDVGTTNAAGRIRVYTGTQPASANDAATGTLLAEFTLANPAWGAASSGVATLAGTPLSTVGLAAGDAGWFRALDRDDNGLFDGAASATGGGAELELDNISIAVDQSVSITAGTYTQPGS